MEEELAATKVQRVCARAEVDRGIEQLGRAKELLWTRVKQDNTLLEAENKMLKQALELFQKTLDKM